MVGSRGRAVVARQAHNLKAVGSNPTPATRTMRQMQLTVEGQPVPKARPRFQVVELQCRKRQGRHPRAMIMVEALPQLPESIE